MVENFRGFLPDETPPEEVPIREWDRLAADLIKSGGPGVYWLDKEKSPTNLQGVFIVVTEQNYWYYWVRNVGHRDNAERDAKSFFGFLTNPRLREAVVVFNGQKGVGVLEHYDSNLNRYAHP